MKALQDYTRARLVGSTFLHRPSSQELAAFQLSSPRSPLPVQLIPKHIGTPWTPTSILQLYTPSHRLIVEAITPPMPHGKRIVPQPCASSGTASCITLSTAAFTTKNRGAFRKDLPSETECQSKDDAKEEDRTDWYSYLFARFLVATAVVRG